MMEKKIKIYTLYLLGFFIFSNSYMGYSKPNSKIQPKNCLDWIDTTITAIKNKTPFRKIVLLFGNSAAEKDSWFKVFLTKDSCFSQVHLGNKLPEKSSFVHAIYQIEHQPLFSSFQKKFGTFQKQSNSLFTIKPTHDEKTLLLITTNSQNPLRVVKVEIQESVHE